MGSDSVKPFLSFNDKWVILLALTSNKGSIDFQHLSSDNKPIYQHVIEQSSLWGDINNTMYVIGATNAEYLKKIRKIIPDHFLLVPGVGAQGGSLENVINFGMTKDCGILVNSSRGIIYAGLNKDFATLARDEAIKIKLKMQLALNKFL
jgi:orotidine-5'-phosphate decarboxylase